MNDVQLEQVIYRYGDVMAADRIDLTVDEGEFFALLGPSGSGKTTVLRLIAGFLEPQDGAITVGGRSMVGVPIYRRNIGFVFQNYALFPHMSVAKNIAFGLENQRLTRTEIERRVDEVLDLVELEGLGSRRPRALSGGQQQRVAVARAIVTEPDVLLLDEPLAALDKKLRTQMQVELRELQQRLGITTIFVTHDQEEAMTLADRIAVMDRGRIAQVGPPREVYEQPCSRFVCAFLGEANLFQGVVAERTGDQSVVVTAGGQRIAIQSDHPSMLGDELTLAVRPEKVRLQSQRPNAAIVLAGQIQHIAYVGTSQNYHVRLDDDIRMAETQMAETQTADAQMIVFEQSGIHVAPPQIGDSVFLSWEPSDTLILAVDDTIGDQSAGTVT